MTIRRPLLLLLIGLVAGLGLGILAGWVLWPVEYYDTEIAILHPRYKFEYAVMVGAAYELDGDWERAEGRLARLKEPDVGLWLQEAIHTAIASGQDPVKIQHAISLAEPLGALTEIMAPFAGGGGG